MIKNTLRGSWVLYPDGVLDTCIIVVTLFDNPLYHKGVEFLSYVLKRDIKAAIPLTSLIGAIHIAIKYLGVESADVIRRVKDILETKSPAFYPAVSVEIVNQAVDYIEDYKISPWDGYIVVLAKKIGNNIVYTFDKHFRKVPGLIIKNPFSEDLVRQYHKYLEDVLGKE